MSGSVMSELELGRSMVPWEWLAALAIVLFVVVVLQALVVRARAWSRRRRIVGRVERAGEGERRALAWLGQLGFDVLGAQVAVTYPVEVDGRTVTVGVRADFLVEKDGARYVVEVKTGALAPRIETPSTRRQLLEYKVAFDVDGILLVDAEAGQLHSVSFPRVG
jgi:hypothetical protein